jgi:hypothetical protein
MLKELLQHKDSTKIWLDTMSGDLFRYKLSIKQLIYIAERGVVQARIHKFIDYFSAWMPKIPENLLKESPMPFK